MDEKPPQDVTQLLADWRHGNEEALEEAWLPHRWR